LDYELHRLAVGSLKRVGILYDVPARPAIQMPHDANFRGRGLVIPNFDLKRFVDPPPIEVEPVFRAAALPGHIKCTAGIQANRLVLGSVVNIVLAGELELPIVIAALEPHAPFWKRLTYIIRAAGFELLHHPNLRM